LDTSTCYQESQSEQWIGDFVEGDRDCGVEICHFLAASQAMDGLCIREFCQGDAMEAASYLRAFATTIWHPVGTCAVGTSVSTGVCDAGFRVWGTDNVHVADASIIPTLPSGNPQAAIFALTNIAAEVIPL
jgi:choline dehydrogenase